MKTLNKTHFLFELECWDRFLKYIELENVCLKNQLAALIKSSKTEDIELLENYLNVFVAKDSLISILRKEVAIQLQALKNTEVYNSEKINHHLRFRKDIQLFKTEFEKMKGEFIVYTTKLN